MKRVFLVLLLLFSFSFVLAEDLNGSAEVTITAESGEVFVFNDSDLVEAYPQKNIFQKMFSLTGFASKGPSCGSLGSSKKYAQNQLSCQQKTNSCPSGSKNLGATYDCKSCCAKTSSDSSGSGSSSGKVGVPPASGVKTVNFKDSMASYGCCVYLGKVLDNSKCESYGPWNCKVSSSSITTNCPGLSAGIDKDRSLHGIRGWNVEISKSYVRNSFKAVGRYGCSYSYK